MKKFGIFGILIIMIFSVPSSAVTSHTEAVTDTIPWGTEIVGAPKVWDKTMGEGIIVAVIDSGIDITHPEFSGAIWNNTDEIPGNGIDDDINGYVDDINGWNFYDNNNDVRDLLDFPHGTHVSGTIAARADGKGIIGVAPKVTIMPLKIFGQDSEGGFGLEEAIQYATDNGADIISMSLGGTSGSSLLEAIINDAWKKGLLLVAANGNEAVDQVNFPAAYDAVIAVSAINSQLQPADFSNIGPETELGAPGVEVLSTVRQDTPSVSFTANGTEYRVHLMEFSPKVTDTIVAPLEYVNLGQTSDFSGKNLTGKIAFIRRGDITFQEKVANAAAAGAKAAIVFNNQPGIFAGTLQATGAIPAVSMSQEDGEAILGQMVNMTVIGNLSESFVSYGYSDGTSMATPHVSAVAALIWSLNSSMSNQEVRKILQRSATDLGAEGRDEFFGFGLINATRGVEVTLDSESPQGTYKVQKTFNDATQTYHYEISIDANDNVGIYKVTMNAYDNGIFTTMLAKTNVDKTSIFSPTFLFSHASDDLEFSIRVEDLRGHVTELGKSVSSSTSTSASVTTTETISTSSISLHLNYQWMVGLAALIPIIIKKRKNIVYLAE